MIQARTNKYRRLGQKGYRQFGQRGHCLLNSLKFVPVSLVLTINLPTFSLILETECKLSFMKAKVMLNGKAASARLYTYVSIAVASSAYCYTKQWQCDNCVDQYYSVPGCIVTTAPGNVLIAGCGVVCAGCHQLCASTADCCRVGQFSCCVWAKVGRSCPRRHRFKRKFKMCLKLWASAVSWHTYTYTVQ